MEAARKWQGLATLGTVLALTAGAAALTSGASATTIVHSCPNKVETLELPSGESGAAPTIFKETIKTIGTHGVSCAAAYKFIGLEVRSKVPTAPEKYKCKVGHFKTAPGYVPELCTKPQRSSSESREARPARTECAAADGDLAGGRPAARRAP